MPVIVSDRAEQGMSTRAIAPVVGADHVTVSRELRTGVADETPVSPVTPAEPTFDPTPSWDPVGLPRHHAFFCFFSFSSLAGSRWSPGGSS